MRLRKEAAEQKGEDGKENETGTVDILGDQEDEDVIF